MSHPPEIQDLLDGVTRLLKESPPQPEGSVSRVGLNGRWRTSSVMFRGSPVFPDGVEIGTTQIMVKNRLGEWRAFQGRYDLSAQHLTELQCYAYNQRAVGKKERLAAQAHRRREKLERSIHGIATTTATAGEHIGRAIDALERAGIKNPAAAVLASVEDQAEEKFEPLPRAPARRTRRKKAEASEE